MSFYITGSLPEHHPEMSEIFTCYICNISFNAKRSLVSHENSQRHREKAGEAVQGYTCPLCLRQFSRTYDISKHQQQRQCPGVQATAAQRTITSNKRKLSADCSSMPNLRIRTTSPTRIGDLSDSNLGCDSSERDAVSPLRPEQAGAGQILNSQDLPSNAGGSGTATSNPFPRAAADHDVSVDADLAAVDVLAETDLDSAKENTYPPPLIDIGPPLIGTAGNIATSAPASSDNQSSPEAQVLPVSEDVDGIATADAMESLTHALKRTSVSSLALSTVTGYSGAPRIRSSIRSYFMNTSLRSIRLSWYSNSSQLSISKRASTVPSEMAGPMLEPIDEELKASRKSGLLLQGYVPNNNNNCQKLFWIAIRENNYKRVAYYLSSWISVIDINCPDASGRSPLVAATFHNHDGVVQLLLDQTGIDVKRRCTMGFTALFYAYRLNRSKIVNLFLSRGWSLSDDEYNQLYPGMRPPVRP